MSLFTHAVREAITHINAALHGFFLLLHIDFGVIGANAHANANALLSKIIVDETFRKFVLLNPFLRVFQLINAQTHAQIWKFRRLANHVYVNFFKSV